MTEHATVNGHNPIALPDATPQDLMQALTILAIDSVMTEKGLTAMDFSRLTQAGQQAVHASALSKAQIALDTAIIGRMQREAAPAH